MKEPLSDALFRYVSGRSPRYDRDYSRSWVTRLVSEAGSQNKLAAALGVARASVQSWVKGGTPSLESQELMRAALRRVQLPASKEARLRASDRITIQGEQDGRQRTITLDQSYLYPGTVSRVVTAYLAGADPSQMQRVLWEGIHDAPFYRTVFAPGGPKAVQERRPLPPPPAGVPAAPAEAGGAPGPPPRPPREYDESDVYDDLAYEGEIVDYDIADSGEIAVGSVR